MVKRLLIVVAFCLGLIAKAEATPTIYQVGGGTCTPSGGVCTTTFNTGAPNNFDIGIMGASCNSPMTNPTSSSGTWLNTFASNHVGTSDYFAVWYKSLSTGDQTQSVGCAGANFAYAEADLSNAGVPTSGSLTTGTAGGAATGSVTVTVTQANCILFEFYEGRTGSGSVPTSFTDTPPSGQTTSLSMSSGTATVNNQVVYAFSTSTDPFSATQPYTNSGTWNHTLSILGSVDVYVCPSVISSPSQWLPFPYLWWN